MFTLPSVWNIVFSTIVFTVAAWYLRQFLAAQGMPKGFTRGISVFVLAYALAWISGALVDWAHDKVVGKTEPAQDDEKNLQELKQMLQQLQQAK